MTQELAMALLNYNIQHWNDLVKERKCSEEEAMAMIVASEIAIDSLQDHIKEKHVWLA